MKTADVHADSMLTKTRTRKKGEKTKLLIVRANDIEQKVLKAKAEKFTGGNYSEFLRLAILRYDPEPSDEEKRQEEYLKKYLK